MYLRCLKRFKYVMCLCVCILTCHFNRCRLTFGLAPRRPCVAFALERALAEKLVDEVLGDGGGYLLQMHAGVRVDVRLLHRGWWLGAAATLEGQLGDELRDAWLSAA